MELQPVSTAGCVQFIMKMFLYKTSVFSSRASKIKSFKYFYCSAHHVKTSVKVLVSALNYLVSCLYLLGQLQPIEGQQFVCDQ